jgi:hypothetical protein
MTVRLCPRQSEVQELLELGHWPQACSPEIQSHVAQCGACAESILLAQAFQQARVATSALAQLPDPGTIWWRAQLRRRNAAIERATRPLAGAYVFALSIALVVASVVAVRQGSHGIHWLETFAQSISLHMQALNPPAWLSSDWSRLIFVPFLATIALLAAVAVYLAAERRQP